MKIGFDAKRLYNNFTGLGNHSRTTIDILTRYCPNNSFVLYTPKIKETVVTTPYLDKPHCTTHFPHGMLKGSIWRTFGIAGDVKHDGVEVFHGLSNELPVGLHVPSVVTIHDVAFKTFPEMYHWQDRQIYDLKWRYALSHADRIVAISETTKKEILSYYDVDESKIDVVYQPVANRYYEPVSRRPMSYPYDSPYMLYVGSINSRKNLLGIVKAMELLPSDLRLPLIVVGNGGTYRQEVEAYIATHNMQDDVIFVGQKINPDELHQLYLHAEVFVYPSFCEGFGLPVAEALLSHCPVVTSNVSSLPEAGGEMSMQADPNDIADISSKIQMVLTDNDLRKRMKDEGYEYAMKKFHPKESAMRLMNIYESLVR